MTRAYDEVFLDDAMENLGNAMEYAICGLGISGQEFLDSFAAGRIGEAYSYGDVRYVSGMSGIELAQRVLQKPFAAIEIDNAPYELRVEYTPEYWIGWALAYYQWYSGHTFSQLAEAIPYDSLRNLYGVLHEADITKVAEVFDEFFDKKDMTRLANVRTSLGLSQSELAKSAGVSLRSIQMYEQRNNDINKAQLNRLLTLSKALGCKIDDILE